MRTLAGLMWLRIGKSGGLFLPSVSCSFPSICLCQRTVVPTRQPAESTLLCVSQRLNKSLPVLCIPCHTVTAFRGHVGYQMGLL